MVLEAGEEVVDPEVVQVEAVAVLVRYVDANTQILATVPLYIIPALRSFYGHRSAVGLVLGHVLLLAAGR